MTISYSDLPTWAQWLVVLAIIIGAVLGIIGFVRKVWPIIARLVHTLDDLDKLQPFMVSQDKFRADINTKVEAVINDVQTIRHEVRPNGGSSLADAVHRTEETANHARRQLAALKTKQDRAEKKLDTHIETATAQVASLEKQGLLPQQPPH